MENNELLARIDERVSAMANDVTEIKTTLSMDYVTKEQFKPVRNIVYGVVSLIASALVAGFWAVISRFHSN